jgi:hypothetical protein
MKRLGMHRPKETHYGKITNIGNVKKVIFELGLGYKIDTTTELEKIREEHFIRAIRLVMLGFIGIMISLSLK